jgi:Putative mono-oxygenase ydhR
MSERSATAFTVLYLRFKLRVAPDVFLAKSREAATIIASVEGLIWKIWIVQQEEFEMGGICRSCNTRRLHQRWMTVAAHHGMPTCRRRELSACLLRRDFNRTH